MQKDIVIFGAGGHGAVVADIVEQQGLYRIAGFLDSGIPKGQERFGYDILGGSVEDAQCELFGGIVAIGDSWIRGKIVGEIRRSS